VGDDSVLPKLREIVIKRMAITEGDLLFPSDRTGKQMKSIKGSIVWACQRAGIPRLTARDFRRTFGTRLHENGFDDKTIADLWGTPDCVWCSATSAARR